MTGVIGILSEMMTDVVFAFQIEVTHLLAGFVRRHMPAQTEALDADIRRGHNTNVQAGVSF